MELTEGEDHVMMEVDETPKEKERERDGCWPRKERQRIVALDHPLVGTLSSPCPSLAFFSLFCSALSARMLLSDQLRRERKRKEERERRTRCGSLTIARRQRMKNIGMPVGARWREITLEEEERESHRGHMEERERSWKLERTWQRGRRERAIPG